MMTTALADEALAHVRATEKLLEANPSAVANKRWRRALAALAEARDELEQGRDALEGARLPEVAPVLRKGTGSGRKPSSVGRRR